MSEEKQSGEGEELTPGEQDRDEDVPDTGTGDFGEGPVRAAIPVAEPALLAVDPSRPEITLAGALTLHDENGDRVAERVHATHLQGSWMAALPGAVGTPLHGSAVASAGAFAP